MRHDLGARRRHLLGDLVAGWISGMRTDVGYLLEACEVAWKAADYVLAASGRTFSR
jgi:hypothetical protein